MGRKYTRLHLFPELSLQADVKGKGRDILREPAGIGKQSFFFPSFLFGAEVPPVAEADLLGCLIHAGRRLSAPHWNDFVLFSLFYEEHSRKRERFLNVPGSFFSSPEKIAPGGKGMDMVAALRIKNDQGFIIAKRLPGRGKTPGAGRFSPSSGGCQQDSRPFPPRQACVEGKPSRLHRPLINRVGSHRHSDEVQIGMVFGPDFTDDVG